MMGGQRSIWMIALHILSFAMTDYTLASTCEDSTRSFLVNRVLRTCDWVGTIQTTKRCGKNQVASHCPKTCGLCTSSYCADSKKRFVLSNGGLKSCAWVGKSNTIARCNKIGDDYTCRASCNQCEKLTVGVYYYPWWAGDFHSGDPNDPHLYLRRLLVEPQQFPSLGEYDDREMGVISQHLKWSRRYNIDLWVSSWWGKDSREDLNLKDNILTNPQLRNHKIAILYETEGRIPPSDDYSLGNVQSDLKYLCEEYFNHSNYYTSGVDVDGNADAASPTRRPVLFVYLTRLLEHENKLQETVDLMREGAREGGCGEIFIVGDQVFGPPPQTEEGLTPFDLLDAVTTYDVYGSMQGGEMGGYVGNREQVTEYYQEQNQWRGLAKDRDCAFVSAVSPGFNDRGVRPEVGNVPLSRRLNETENEGSLFEVALEEARTIVDTDIGNLVMVNSWNEWHEDTQIEPCIAVGGSTVSTNLPTDLTYGLEYEGYGSLYLKILKEMTTSWEPSMVVPASAAGAMANAKPIPSNVFLNGK